ncbi:MAG TPA: DUF1080 domain-containing protein [Prolixibacteraceae bacterium]|nr:DUF1080 domain-containing protein [Prolixibacteraceae bacterium]
MRKTQSIVIIILLACISNACKTENSFLSLFNGENLENWDLYLDSSLGDKFDSATAIVTPEDVFSIISLNGENVIRISGEVNGSLATKENYNNYHLKLVFCWGDTVFTSRNSGLLYHSFGQFGAAFGTWMANIECQLMHQNMGDTYLMLNTVCQTNAQKSENSNKFIFTPNAQAIDFGQHANGSMIRKASNHEKPIGEWNTIELYCFGTTAIHVVNGVTVMVNKNTGTFENGKTKPLNSGKIQIQSEGSELFIKTVEIRSIKEIPNEILP